MTTKKETSAKKAVTTKKVIKPKVAKVANVAKPKVAKVAKPKVAKVAKVVKVVKVAKPKVAKVAKPKVAKVAKPKVVRKRKVNYLNNKDMLKEVILSKEQDQMTNTLAHMLQTLGAKYGKKGNFVNYTYNEDMQAYAMLMLVNTWRSFKPEKSSNPFAFFTQCIKNSFIQFLKKEKKQRDVRDELLVDQGLSPSHTYQMEHEARLKSHKEVDSHDAHVDDNNDIDVPQREEIGDQSIESV